MATKGKSGKKGGGKRKLSGKQLRYLFSSGVLGKTKKGKTKYNKKRSKQLGRLKKRGVDTTVKAKYRNTPSGSTRPVIGGSKAAGLRSGAGSGAAKRDFSATRAARIAAGKALIDRDSPNYKALSRPNQEMITMTYYKRGNETRRDAAKRERDDRAYFAGQAARDARSDRLNAIAGGNKKVQTFYGLQERLGRAGAIAAAKNRPARIAAGRAKAAEFKAKRDAAYNGGLFGSKPSPTPKPRPDYSSTRAQRVAAGNKIANSLPVARKALKGTGLRVRESNRADAAQNPLMAGGSSKTRMNAAGPTRFLVQTARTTGAKAPRPKVGTAANNATRAARVAAGKAIAARNPEVQKWKGNEKNMVIANRYSARAKAEGRKQATAKVVAVKKATDAYTRALVRANANIFDDKGQRGRRRAYDKLISTVSGGFKSKSGAYKPEIDSALRRARAAARKKGSYLP